MNGTVYLWEPVACTGQGRRDFERLVRQGFEGSDDSLPDRIRTANRLAFNYAAGGTLAVAAALKAPNEQYRDDVFRKSEARVSPADFRLELGWVFVDPDHRGKRIGERLCPQLLAYVPASSVFATTAQTTFR